MQIQDSFLLDEVRCGFLIPATLKLHNFPYIAGIDVFVLDYLTQLFPWGLKGEGFQFPKEYYEQSVYLPFECTQMPVPLMYDKMLRQRYGDYMRLVKTAGAHDYPFFEGQKKNLQAVLNFKLPEFRFEKAKLCRSEEEESYKNLSYKAMARECTDELWRMKEELDEAMKLMFKTKELQYREQAMKLLLTWRQTF